MIVRHQDDEECKCNVEKYRRLLKESDTTFVDMPLDKLLSVYDAMELSEELAHWLQKFKERYL